MRFRGMPGKTLRSALANRGSAARAPDVRMPAGRGRPRGGRRAPLAARAPWRPAPQARRAAARRPSGTQGHRPGLCRARISGPGPRGNRIRR